MNIFVNLSAAMKSGPLAARVSTGLRQMHLSQNRTFPDIQTINPKEWFAESIKPCSTPGTIAK
jgi:hypothetical protein